MSSNVLLLRAPTGPPDKYESAFSNAGYTPQSVPVLTTVLTNITELAAALPRDDAVIITSARAVEAVAEALVLARSQAQSEPQPQTQALVGTSSITTTTAELTTTLPPFYVVGSATATALRAVLPHADVRGEGSGTAEQLAYYILANPPESGGRTLLYLTGDKNRETLAGILTGSPSPSSSSSSSSTSSSAPTPRTPASQSTAAVSVASQSTVAEAPASSASMVSSPPPAPYILHPLKVYETAPSPTLGEAFDALDPPLQMKQGEGEGKGKGRWWVVFFAPSAAEMAWGHLRAYCESSESSGALADSGVASSGRDVDGSTDSTVDASSNPTVDVSSHPTVYASSHPTVYASSHRTVDASTHPTVDVSTNPTVDASGGGRKVQVNVRVAAIGPTTAAFLRDALGLEVNVVAPRPSAEALVEAILAFDREN